MQVQGLEIHASACAGNQTLIVAGEVDMATSPSLEDAVGRACSGYPAKLVLDLTRVTFIDSTGLNAILSARALCVRRTLGFEVVIATPQVKRVFEICGLRSAPFLTLVDASAAAAAAARVIAIDAYRLHREGRSPSRSARAESRRPSRPALATTSQPPSGPRSPSRGPLTQAF